MSANAVPQDEVKKIVEMGRANKPVMLIMEETGRHKQTIYKILRRHGVPVSRERITNSLKYKQQMEQIIRKVEQGVTLSKIAADMGMSQSTISQRLAKYYEKEKEEKFYWLMRKPKDDPRSAECQKIDVCQHSRCHMHEKCPAYHNYLRKYHKSERNGA